MLRVYRVHAVLVLGLVLVSWAPSWGEVYISRQFDGPLVDEELIIGRIIEGSTEEMAANALAFIREAITNKRRVAWKQFCFDLIVAAKDKERNLLETAASGQRDEGVVLRLTRSQALYTLSPEDNTRFRSFLDALPNSEAEWRVCFTGERVREYLVCRLLAHRALRGCTEAAQGIVRMSNVIPEKNWGSYTFKAFAEVLGATPTVFCEGPVPIHYKNAFFQECVAEYSVRDVPRKRLRALASGQAGNIPQEWREFFKGVAEQAWLIRHKMTD